MKKTYEYRAYPTVKQANKLVAWLEILRNLYNQALAWRKETYEQTGQSVKKSTQEKALTPFRRESAPVASLHIDVLQDTIDRKKAAVALRVPILGIPICRERCVGSQRPRNPPFGDRSAELGKTHWTDKQEPSFRAG